MSDKTKKLIGWALVSVAIIVAAFLGVNFPAPPPPVDLGQVIERSGVGQAIKFDRAVKFAQPVGMDQTLAVTGNTTVGGGLTVTGAIVGGSFSPATFSSATDLYADTGTFTTSLKLAGTAVARLAGSAIDATSLKVAATAVALQSGSAIDATSLKVAATPVALQVGALAGKRIVCGSTTLTGTGALPHGLATPSVVTLGMGQDATGDGARLTFTNASGTVTAKAWNSALTPAPATTPVVVDWCVNGTP